MAARKNKTVEVRGREFREKETCVRCGWTGKGVRFRIRHESGEYSERVWKCGCCGKEHNLNR